MFYASKVQFIRNIWMSVIVHEFMKQLMDKKTKQATEARQVHISTIQADARRRGYRGLHFQFGGSPQAGVSTCQVLENGLFNSHHAQGESVGEEDGYHGRLQIYRRR